MHPLTKEQLLQAIPHFTFEGELIGIAENHNGHINDTFELTFLQKDGSKRRYILQRVNSDVFPHVDQVMSNIDSVLSYMGKKIEERGGNQEKDKLTLVRAKEGASYYESKDKDCFRAYLYLEGTVAYNQATPEIFEQSGFAFGRFQRDLDGFPAEKLYEVIPHFHDTPARYENLLKSIEANKSGRRDLAKDQIEWAEANSYIKGLLQNKGLPIRVTHNDTKLNNVMFDEKTGKASCVIDLDTIMPGLSLYDFGDSIRFGANTAVEDEKDLSKVKLDLNLFAHYVKGFLEGADGTLTKQEISLFPEAGMVLTYECGIRFLSDYLDGDTYFKTAYPDHNLVRAKDQFALVDSMKAQLPEMRKIVEPYLK